MAFDRVSGATAGLAVMLERKQGSPTMLRIIASKYEEAAKMIRDAVGDEQMETERQSNGSRPIPKGRS